MFYQDQTAAQALATEDSALLSALVGIIILFMQERQSQAAFKGVEKNTKQKTVKAGDLGKGNSPT